MYVSAFEADLEREIVSETSGDFKRLALSLLQGHRDESETVDKEVAKEDAMVTGQFLNMENCEIEHFNFRLLYD